jgi:HK97 gp10 family phage protein
MAVGKGPKVAFALTGWRELIKNLNTVGVKLDDTDPEIKNVLIEPARAMVANAQNLAPVGKKRTAKHQPGELRRSIIALTGPPRQRGVIMVSRKKIAPYCVYVEFGTSKMMARPFFRPAILAMASTYAADIAPGVKRIAEKNAAANAFHPPK